MKIIKTYTLLSLCLLSFSTFVFAQNDIIDSLKNELSLHTNKDSIRVDILNVLAFYHHRSDPLKSMEYAERAGELSDEIEFPKGKARSIYMKGIAQIGQSNLEQSIQSLQEAIRKYAAINDRSGIAGCNNALGLVYNYQGQHDRALESYQKALETDTELGIEKNIANYLYNMANIYADTGRYPEALDNFKKALDIYKSTDNRWGILECYNAMAIVYNEQGNYPLSLEYHNNSLLTAEESKDSIAIFQSLNNIGNVYRQQEKFDKALELYEKALNIEQKNHNSKNITAIQSNMAAIYIQKKEYDTAIPLLESAIALSEEKGITRQVAICFQHLGVIYLAKKAYPDALFYFKKARDLSIEHQVRYDQAESYLGIARVYYHQKEDRLALLNARQSAQIAEELQLIKIHRDAYELMSRIYDRMGNYKKAFDHHKLYKNLNDSIFNKRNIEKITQLEYEYKYKRQLDSANEREQKLTQEVIKTSDDLEKSQRNIFLTIIAFLLTALILGGVIFFLKLRNAKTKNQNILIEQKLLRSQMTPHFIFNSLSVLQGMILNKEEKNAVSYLSKFSKLLRTILENSRYKTVALSSELSAINSYMALQNLAINPPYEYHLKVDSEIDQSALKIPPMLIQPFIENAIEHAFVDKKEHKKIEVDISFKDQTLTCTIADNGIGVGKEEEIIQKNKNSLATSITSERLIMLAKEFKTPGSLSVMNRAIFGEQGTLVTLVIPYKIKPV